MAGPFSLTSSSSFLVHASYALTCTSIVGAAGGWSTGASVSLAPLAVSSLAPTARSSGEGAADAGPSEKVKGWYSKRLIAGTLSHRMPVLAAIAWTGRARTREVTPNCGQRQGQGR
jgi:hypothetical protein